MTDAETQKQHDTMVQVKSILLKFDKFDNIRANFPGNPDVPETMTDRETSNTFLPDITADGEEFTIFEVETAESLQSADTEKSWTFYARYAQENDATFRVVVPKGMADAARQRLLDMKIEAQVDEVIET